RRPVLGQGGRASASAGLDVGGLVRPPPAARTAAPQLQPPVEIRPHRPRLVAAGPRGGCALTPRRSAVQPPAASQRIGGSTNRRRPPSETPPDRPPATLE